MNVRYLDRWIRRELIMWCLSLFKKWNVFGFCRWRYGGDEGGGGGGDGGGGWWQAVFNLVAESQTEVWPALRRLVSGVLMGFNKLLKAKWGRFTCHPFGFVCCHRILLLLFIIYVFPLILLKLYMKIILFKAMWTTWSNLIIKYQSLLFTFIYISIAKFLFIKRNFIFILGFMITWP